MTVREPVLWLEAFSVGLFSFSRDEFSSLLQKEGLKEDLSLTALNFLLLLPCLPPQFLFPLHILLLYLSLCICCPPSCLPLLFPDKNSLVFCLWETRRRWEVVSVKRQTGGDVGDRTILLYTVFSGKYCAPSLSFSRFITLSFEPYISKTFKSFAKGFVG